MGLQHLLAVGAAVTLACGHAHADLLTYVSASRTLTVNSTYGYYFNPSTAATGNWNTFANSYDPTGVHGGTGLASQDSTLGPDSIFGTLSARSCTGLNAGGSAASTLSAQFQITSDLNLSLTGSVSCDPVGLGCPYGFGAAGFATLSLSGPSGTIYSVRRPVTQGDCTVTGALNFSGLLPAGTYSITVSAQNSYQGEAAAAGGCKNAGVSFSAVFSASGVCCRGSTCSTSVTPASCTAPTAHAGAAFVSAATACNAGGNRTAPCCESDYNKAGGVSVQDIFDFLGDWFAGSPFARVGGDGTGAAPPIQSLFDFLTAWFAGCP